MGKYRAYPEYKDSGVEWLGGLPSEWVVSKVSYISQCLDGKRIPLNATERGEMQGDIPYWGANGVVDYVDDWLFDEELVLLGEDGAPFFDPVKPVAFCVSGKIWVNNHTHILRADRSKVAPAFLAQALNSVQYQYYITGSTRDKLTQSDMGRIQIHLPSLTEQSQIASFLDRETAKIDRLIVKQEALIDLLKEKRQAVISHAVTKGLDPDAPMKDSGVEWLGEIPAHWKVKRLKHLAKLQSGIAKGKNLAGKETITVPYLRVANVQDGYVDLSDVANIEIEPQDLPRYLLRKGDVLMNEGGDNDKLGRGTIWNGEIDPCIHQNHVFAIRPHAVEPEWVSLLTQASYLKFHFYSCSKQSTNLASISGTNTMEAPLVIPPSKERDDIRRHIEAVTAKLDQVIQCAEKKNILLQERRSALISAAVTGKIDVREEVA